MVLYDTIRIFHNVQFYIHFIMITLITLIYNIIYDYYVTAVYEGTRKKRGTETVRASISKLRNVVLIRACARKG